MSDKQTTEVKDAEFEMVPSESNRFMPALTVDKAGERYQQLVAFVKQQMREGTDFGKSPGTDKPTLLKPGAEKLCTFFGLTKPVPATLVRIEDWTGAEHGGEPFFYYQVSQELLRDGKLVAGALASCNSWEKKYRYRKSERKCPKCGKAAIIKGKEEYGGGWLCYAKKDGCGAKFKDNDASITSQLGAPVKNEFIFDQVNTILKMACKRALIGATLLAVNASEFFTQDMEDAGNGHDDYEDAPPPPQDHNNSGKKGQGNSNGQRKQNGQQPAGEPAKPTRPEKEDGEVIDDATRESLIKALAEKKRTWEQTAAWLSQKADFPADGKIKDVTRFQYHLILDALNGRIKKAPVPAK